MIKHFPRSNTPLESVSKAEHATNIHRPRALSKSLSERAPRHENIFFQVWSARPKQVFLQPSAFFSFFFFSIRGNTSSGRARDKKNYQFEHMTKNPQKTKYFSGSIPDQTFPQVHHTYKNLLSGTKNSKMLLDSNTADRSGNARTNYKKKTCDKQTENFG